MINMDKKAMPYFIGAYVLGLMIIVLLGDFIALMRRGRFTLIYVEENTLDVSGDLDGFISRAVEMPQTIEGEFTQDADTIEREAGLAADDSRPN